MKSSVRVACMLASASLLAAAASGARAAEEAPSSLRSGTRARPIERPLPIYPEIEETLGNEGWVIASFVVHVDGSVGDVVIEDSSGRRSFERAVARAIREWRYEPATLGGKPVEQCDSKVLFPFMMRMSRRDREASLSYTRSYGKVRRAIEEDRLAEARAGLEELFSREQTSYYEISHLWMLRSTLQHKEGDPAGRLTSLQRAVVAAEDVLDPKLHAEVLRSIFVLQVQLQRYRDALDTLATLQSLPKAPEVPEALLGAAARIRELEAGDQAFAVDGVIAPPKEEGTELGHWSRALLRRMPGIEGGEGGIDQVELRCDSHRVVAKPEPGRAWRIPEEWGICSIYVFGRPGTTFRLVEYPAAAAAVP